MNQGAGMSSVSLLPTLRIQLYSPLFSYARLRIYSQKYEIIFL